MILHFNIPRKPMASPRPRFTTYAGFPKAYFPKSYTVEKQIISDLFLNDYGNYFATYNGDVQVRIECHMPFPKTTFNGFNGKKAEISKELNTLKAHNQKPDLDNIAKTYLDSLNGIAWEDDSQISKLVVVKKWSFTEEVLIDIEYTQIISKEEIPYFKDKLEQEEIEKVEKIYNERK